jgi:hypothetical protein
MFEVIQLFHWRPGEQPEAGQRGAAPFRLAMRLAELSQSLKHMASIRTNSGG